MPTYHDEKDTVTPPSITQDQPCDPTPVPTIEQSLTLISTRLDEITQMLRQLGVRT